MGLIKLLSTSESIYVINKKFNEIANVNVAVDSSGKEYFLESYIDDLTMWVTRPNGIRAKVWIKNFKIKLRKEGYMLLT